MKDVVLTTRMNGQKLKIETNEGKSKRKKEKGSMHARRGWVIRCNTYTPYFEDSINTNTLSYSFHRNS